MRVLRVLHIGDANASFFIENINDLCYTESGKLVLEMRDDKLSAQSMDFAVSIINLVKFLKDNKEHIISNQIGRSGTSVGANICEAQYAHGKADFIAKLQIALKEANETGYWLELLYKTNYISENQYNLLDKTCAGLRAMLIASISTAKRCASDATCLEDGRDTYGELRLVSPHSLTVMIGKDGQNNVLILSVRTALCVRSEKPRQRTDVCVKDFCLHTIHKSASRM